MKVPCLTTRDVSKQAARDLSAIAAPAAYIVCMVLVFELVSDIRDVEGDQATGAQTLPVVFGEVMQHIAVNGFPVICRWVNSAQLVNIAGTQAVVQATTSVAILAAGMPTWTLISRMHQASLQYELYSTPISAEYHAKQC